MTTAKEGMYMITKIISGSVVERRKTYVGHRPSRRGARIKGASSEKKQENNRQQAILALARTLNCNYSHGDGYLTLSFTDDALAACGGTLEGAKKAGRKFLDRVAYRMKKHGKVLKWVIAPSELDGETGELVRVHVHVVISGHGLRLEDGVFWLYDEKLEDVWGNGEVDVQILRRQKDYYPLARYLILQARGVADEKKYSVSRNMVKPKVEHLYTYSPAPLRVPTGASALPGTRYDPEAGVNFVRYIPAQRDPARKVGGSKEMAVACAGKPLEGGDGDGV